MVALSKRDVVETMNGTPGIIGKTISDVAKAYSLEDINKAYDTSKMMQKSYSAVSPNQATKGQTKEEDQARTPRFGNK